MPPKKKGKRDPSSSSVTFDMRRFLDAQAAVNYSKLLKKNMHKERGMNMHQPDAITLIHAQNRRWGEFVKPPPNAVMSLVREFYANLKVKNEEFHVKVRGRMVAFDSRTINALYDMPDFETDEYTVFKGEPFPYDAVTQFICRPRTTWKLNKQGEPVTFLASALEREPNNWHQFVASRMLPTGHTANVTKARAGLIYCILMRKTIDAGRVIQNSIFDAARGTSTISMPHSSLITELCRAAGVVWDNSEQLLPTRAPIELLMPLPREKRHREMEARNEVGTASGSGQPQQPAPHAFKERSTNERLDDLERRMKTQWKLTREHMAYMHDFTVALAQRFPSSSSSDMPFPMPPAWSHQPAEDDIESLVGEEAEDDDDDTRS